MYSTALPEHAAAMIRNSYAIFPHMRDEREHLRHLIQLFQSANIHFEKLLSQTPIQIVIIPGNNEIKTIAEKLQQKGFDVRPVLYPTIPQGKERLRIVLHAFNTEDEVRNLLAALK
jgi:8-amino-7-oxononanoate synthase